MRGLSAIFILLAIALGVAAQSGRNKPSETPSPTPTNRRATEYVTIEAKQDSTRPRISPSPTPTPKLKDDEIIKINATLVPIPVSVIDADGRAVTTLKASDFELRIDGKVVPIDSITRSESPIRLAMLFDNSSSVLIARDFERDAAVRFFKRVIRPDRDMAALFTVADDTQMDQPMTRDVSLLIHAINLIPEPKGATALLDGIIQVAQYLKLSSGRRIMVIVSDGEDTYSDMKTTLEDVVKALQINDCQVYVVKTKDFENFKRTGIRGGNANIRALTAERRMIEIGQQTGGAVYSPIDDPEMDQAFNQISGELAEQYILSYYPDETDNKPGDFHAITVTIKDHANLNVRTRKGYYEPKKD